MTAVARLDVVPDIPTVGEVVPGFEASTWFGVGAPKNTPAEVVGKLNKEINAGLADPKLKARFADLGSCKIVSQGTLESLDKLDSILADRAVVNRL